MDACIGVGACVLQYYKHAPGVTFTRNAMRTDRPITWTEDRRGEQVELPGSPLPFLTQPCTSHAAPLCSFAFALSAASLALSRFHLAVALRFPFSIFDLTCET